MNQMTEIQQPQMDMPITNLDAIITAGGLAERKIGTLLGHNLGHNTLTLAIPMHEFFDISEVANERNIADKGMYQDETVAQRPLDKKHAEKLAVYILKGMVNAVVQRYTRQGKPLPKALERIHHALGKQPYLSLQPIVTNIRGIGFGGTSGLRFDPPKDGLIYVYLGTKDVLWVIDGQHRRYAMSMLFSYLRQLMETLKYPKRPDLYPHEKGIEKIEPDEAAIWTQIFEIGRTACTISVEVHLGLDAMQERQLFYDLNNLGKKVESGMAFNFDQSNPVNQWIKTVLLEDGVLGASVEDKDVPDWHDDPGVIARKDLIAVNAILFLNKTNVSGAIPQDVETKEAVNKRFWEIVSAIDGFGQTGAKQITVAAQPVMLKAIAKLTYDCAFGRDSKDPGNLAKLFEGIEQGNIDFAHDNPMWRYYQLSEDQRIEHGLTKLAEYLPSEATGNRDIGQYAESTKLMRFGAKHNDIYPILGDMIRWKLGLPNRNTKQPQVVALSSF